MNPLLKESCNRQPVNNNQNGTENKDWKVKKQIPVTTSYCRHGELHLLKPKVLKLLSFPLIAAVAIQICGIATCARAPIARMPHRAIVFIPIALGLLRTIFCTVAPPVTGCTNSVVVVAKPSRVKWVKNPYNRRLGPWAPKTISIVQI